MKLFASLSAAAILVPAGVLLSRSEAAPSAPPSALASSPAQPEGPTAGSFEIDAGHSSVHFFVTHAKASNAWGRFNKFSGKFTVNPERPAASSIEITIQADSVDTNLGDRDQHLRGPDFFNSKEFPEIVFESKKVDKSADGFKISGELSLLGVSKEISVDAKYVGSSEFPQMGKRCGYQVEFKILRSDFGMKYGLPDMLGDEVHVIASLEGAAK